MKPILVAAAVVNQTPLDWDGNKDRLVAVLRAAKAAGVSVLCLPEMCISGYGCEDAFMGIGTQAQAHRVLFELLTETRGMVVSFGVPLLYHNALFNTAVLVADGQIMGFVAKRFLAGDGIHYEPRWFKPWKEGHRSSVELEGKEYPCGDLMFDAGGVKLGFEICEDAWVATRPGAALAKAGVDIILNPSASHFAFGKFETRKRFVVEGSRAFGVSYVYANLLGNESGRVVYDGGALIASGGRLLAAGPRLGSLTGTSLLPLSMSRRHAWHRRVLPASILTWTNLVTLGYARHSPGRRCPISHRIKAHHPRGRALHASRRRSLRGPLPWRCLTISERATLWALW